MYSFISIKEYRLYCGYILLFTTMALALLCSVQIDLGQQPILIVIAVHGSNSLLSSAPTDWTLPPGPGHLYVPALCMPNTSIVPLPPTQRKKQSSRESKDDFGKQFF